MRGSWPVWLWRPRGWKPGARPAWPTRPGNYCWWSWRTRLCGCPPMRTTPRCHPHEPTVEAKRRFGRCLSMCDGAKPLPAFDFAAQVTEIFLPCGRVRNSHGDLPVLPPQDPHPSSQAEGTHPMPQDGATPLPEFDHSLRVKEIRPPVVRIWREGSHRGLPPHD
ncbi:protein of unknown function [Candidatus Hydrogenisulfobacillus filiaventi]|uniref:Uncharacterized protein n=1 Tax=Candidatus Hydrogenisulfobacillus filiaventi TaxID=2707344 RepID=A0A6F8ZJ92_9FIRM|nr:protein of unknown function [Candidatus Hydrogenisulfobacillus filiaventi]